MITHVVDSLTPIRDKLVLWKDDREGLQCLSVNGFETRHDAVLGLVEQADREHALRPFGPLLVHTLDRPISTPGDDFRALSFCTAEGYHDVPVPDFVFGGWPQVGIDDFDETCGSIEAAGDRPAHLPVVGWIGSLRTHPVRSVLHELGHQHPDLLDIQRVDWVASGSATRLGTAGGNALSLAEQAARWGALIDVEGKGYSGRVKLLLHSGRPLLLQDRPWTEWFFGDLVAMEHYIPVRRDLSDLVERARWVQENPEQAAQIGRAGQTFAQRSLDRATAVRRWAEVLSVAGGAAPTASWGPADLRAALDPVLRRHGVAV